MIYLVTNQVEVFNDSSAYKIITVEESLNIMSSWKTCQFDTETTGTDFILDKLLTMQFGSFDKEIQIVVDCTTVNPVAYKNILETLFLIGQNIKFDLEFLYKIKIYPNQVYDTMIAEQVLYLGYPSGEITYNLKDIAERYLNIYLDKTVRGEIIWRGLDTKVIQYAANDVVHLYDIMRLQMLKAKYQEVTEAIKLECQFVPVIAYLEYCGIKLDEFKWRAKMLKDKQALENAEINLIKFVANNPKLAKFIYYDRQGDLFNGFDLSPKCKINWSSSKQVIEVAKLLGFNTQVKDKKTGEDKDSVLEKHLASQIGINDEFLKLYFDYQEHFKVVSSFGQGHLNAINPITNRIHTVYKQLGAASGRMSCGSQQPNKTLAKLKQIKPSSCTYPNLQQLPHDAETRACFVAEKGNKLIDCDWSAAEARLAGDIYNDQAIKDIFLKGIDSHSMYAKIFFAEELKDVDVNDVKKLRPDLRQLAKGPEFALNFGGGVFAIKNAIHCTDEEAEQILKNYNEGFKGSAEFAKKGSEFVRSHGYVLMNPITGHKMYWHDYKYWLEYHKTFTPEFWEDYKTNHKGTGDIVCQSVSTHFKAASKWDRMARNAPTQGTCAIMLKRSQIRLFDYVKSNNLIGKAKLCALVHDECLWEVPEDIAQDFAKLIEKEMLDAAAYYCKSLPIPAEADIADCWKH